MLKRLATAECCIFHMQHGCNAVLQHSLAGVCRLLSAGSLGLLPRTYIIPIALSLQTSEVTDDTVSQLSAATAPPALP